MKKNLTQAIEGHLERDMQKTAADMFALGDIKDPALKGFAESIYKARFSYQDKKKKWMYPMRDIFERGYDPQEIDEERNGPLENANQIKKAA